MPSASLIHWQAHRRLGLDEIDAQCRACGTAIPPNARLIDENFRGYILLLSAHFQGYCRDLYTECAQIIASKVRARLQVLVQEQFTSSRKLDFGNPNIENLKKDFNRFGMDLKMGTYDLANEPRLALLKQLNDWRNIAAHHGTVPQAGLPPLATIQGWRNSCDGLATSLDDIMYNHLRNILRRPPWTP